MADLKQASRRDPTILHPFLAERAELVTIKQNNPNSRLMEKGLLAKRVSVNAADVAETGLEAPPSYFVELWKYRQLHGGQDPDPERIVKMNLGGFTVPGVEVEDENMKGIHKRINRSYNSVKKIAHIHEGDITLNRQAPNEIFEETRKQVISQQSKAPALSMAFGTPVGIASSSSTDAPQKKTDSVDAQDGHETQHADEDDEEATNLTSWLSEFGFCKRSDATSPAKASAKAKAEKPKSTRKNPSSTITKPKKPEKPVEAAPPAPKRRSSKMETSEGKGVDGQPEPASKPAEEVADDTIRRRGRKQTSQLDMEDREALDKIKEELASYSTIEADSMDDFQYYVKLAKSMGKINTQLVQKQRTMQRRSAPSSVAGEFEEVGAQIKAVIDIAKAFSSQDGDKLNSLLENMSGSLSLGLSSEKQRIKLLAFADLASGRWDELETKTVPMISDLDIDNGQKFEFLHLLVTNLFQRLLRGKASGGIVSAASLDVHAFDFVREFTSRMPPILAKQAFAQTSEAFKDLSEDFATVEVLLSANSKLPADVKKALENVASHESRQKHIRRSSLGLVTTMMNGLQEKLMETANAHVKTNLIPYVVAFTADLKGSDQPETWTIRKLQSIANPKLKKLLQIHDVLKDLKETLNSMSQNGTALGEKVVHDLVTGLRALQQPANEFGAGLADALAGLIAKINSTADSVIDSFLEQQRKSMASWVDEHKDASSGKPTSADVDALSQIVESFCRSCAAAKPSDVDRQCQVDAATFMVRFFHCWSLLPSADDETELAPEFIKLTRELVSMLKLEKDIFKDEATWSQIHMPLYLINFLENMTALLGSDSDTTVVEPVVKNVFGTYRAGCLKSIAKAESKCSDVLNLNRGVSFPVYNPDLGPDAADRTYCGIADAMALKLFATEARDAKQLCQEAVKMTGAPTESFVGYTRVVSFHREVLETMTTRTIIKVLQSKAAIETRKSQLANCMQLAQDEMLSIPASVQARATDL
ncbi:unnamed protein product [Durusdinium trenchii]|uniref:Uncharacterized protein n=1 Tax=Durusdinium trenchii TaxID=1381693 RepID=A0ABP0R7J4_9DINO